MSKVVPLATVESAMPAATVSAITFAPTMAVTAAVPEAATLTAIEFMDDESMAARSTRSPASTVEFPPMKASMLLVITLPKADAWTATVPAAPTPTVIAIMPESDREDTTTSPPAVTSAPSISALTAFVITFPETAALTATVPEPATLTMIARMPAFRSTGVPSRAVSSSASFSSDSIQSGSTLGAWSMAETETSPPAVTVEPPVMPAVTSLAIALPSAETATETVPAPEAPMASARMIADDSAVTITLASEETVAPSILASRVLVIALAAAPPPTATSLAPAAPTDRASIEDASMAEAVTSPCASTREPRTISAAIVLLMTLTDRLTPAAIAPLEPAPPTVRLMICELFVSGSTIPDVPRLMSARSAAVSGGAIPAATVTFPAVEVTVEPSTSAWIAFCS